VTGCVRMFRELQEQDVRPVGGSGAISRWFSNISGGEGTHGTRPNSRQVFKLEFGKHKITDAPNVRDDASGAECRRHAGDRG